MCHVLEPFHRRHLLLQVRVERETGAGEIPEALVVIEPAGEAHDPLDAQVGRQAAERWKRLAVADEDEQRIAPPELPGVALDRPEGEIDVILRPHHTQPADEVICALSQSRIRIFPSGMRVKVARK